MNIAMIQTSDSKKYIGTLALNGRVNELYCKIQGISYRPFIGIKRGFYAWHATFNRIILLSEMMNQPELDWIIFLDADAHVYDIEFQIRTYLSDKDHYCLIIERAHDDSPKWDVNAGVFFLNLRHRLGRKLIENWKKGFYEWIPDEQLSWYAYPWWPFNDQDILHRILADDTEMLTSTLVIGRGLINYPDGQYIRQWGKRSDAEEALARARALWAAKADRSNQGDVSGMTETPLDNMLREALRERPVPEAGLDQVSVAERFVRAVYRTLLLRDPELDGLAHHVNSLCAAKLDFEACLRTILSSSEFRLGITQFLSELEIPSRYEIVLSPPRPPNE